MNMESPALLLLVIQRKTSTTIMFPKIYITNMERVTMRPSAGTIRVGSYVRVDESKEIRTERLRQRRELDTPVGERDTWFGAITC